MWRKLKSMKQQKLNVSNEQTRDDSLNRSLSLVLQTMALNVLSLLIILLIQVANMLEYVSFLFNCPNATAFFHSLLLFFQKLIGVTYLNSNLGFFVHCCYSQSYRDATLHVFRSVKKALTIKLKKVVPESKHGETVEERSFQLRLRSSIVVHQ